VEEAKAEGNDGAVESFENALAVEEIHHALYSEAAEVLMGGNDLAAAPIYVCPVCGNTVGTPPSPCPVCGSPKSKFVEIT